MGTYNYLIIPLLEVKIMTKFSYDNELMNNNYDKIFNNEELEYDEYGQLDYPRQEDIKLKDIQNLSLKDISKLYNIVEIFENVVNPIYLEEVLCYYLESKGIDFLILNEHEEEELEKYKNYKTIGL